MGNILSGKGWKMTEAEVIECVQPKVQAIFDGFIEVLGPGKRFLVTVAVIQTPTLEIILEHDSTTTITDEEWDYVFSRRKWGSYNHKMLAIFRGNGNQRLSQKDAYAISNTSWHTRERLNRALFKIGSTLYLDFWDGGDNNHSFFQMKHRP